MNNSSSRAIIRTLAIIFGLAISGLASSVDGGLAATSDRDSTPFKPERTKLAQFNGSCQRLTYSPFGIIYESELYMNGYIGMMVTRFFNQNTNRPEAVQQMMQVVNSPQGLVLSGSNPVYLGTNIEHPTYIPDNFLFQIQPNGTYSAIAYDNLRRTAPVAISACSVG